MFMTIIIIIIIILSTSRWIFKQQYYKLFTKNWIKLVPFFLKRNASVLQFLY